MINIFIIDIDGYMGGSNLGEGGGYLGPCRKVLVFIFAGSPANSGKVQKISEDRCGKYGYNTSFGCNLINILHG
jgi:hypothetical protein